VLVTILAGNSTLRWIVWDGEAETGRGALLVSELGTGDGLPASLTQGLRGAARAVLASVNPPLADRVRAAAAAADTPLAVYGESPALPLRLSPAMTDPGGIGRDRLIASYAAWRLLGGPVVIVDVGTALTVNGVDADGRFAGGAIAVGPHLAAQALAQGTEQLPLAPAQAAERALGRNTAEALAAGISIGLGGQVRALVDAVRAELGAPGCPVVATGGGLERLAGVDGLFARVEPDLALIGLRLAAAAAPGPTAE